MQVTKLVEKSIDEVTDGMANVTVGGAATSTA